MPIYVYRCECGARFERLTGFDAAAPGCPSCGGRTRKIQAGFSLGGQAGAGLAKEQMPQTWRGVYNAHPEYIGRMQRQWEGRQRLEAKYPEIAGDQPDHRPRGSLPRHAAEGRRPRRRNG